ncbi:GNAT family protein [Campylobacter canadensis]|uniref:GNAT family N-acetyltransferase n=1 Tax=Campylobacter canadensis TaxID=449520 RepID=A0ABS7WT31_9BACT|nr:GNAT family N-acetyltransferase [Campylobacter canadensis]MBZ7987940.1 GNAT family N-acetyltransferase [Campylobacter canadensis]MBZ7995059.1 GNAT family N-acetyltransferase [Campylobacter canadensis]MBZ7996665.1 GNAT family N-acetyltransferase [Campylobacter canadensis]MBZ7998533.1 GNAT family N-acetyltransferase [Campylobacter canadensis]MBZ8000272.1 GNAT family N-acetyltransferase [Campylobacter canadensis]
MIIIKPATILLNELCVNEQKPLARIFYERMGFVIYKRSDLDEQGNPYPLLYMKMA